MAELFTPEVITALLATGGTLFAFLIRAGWRWLVAYVKGTPATWDDALVAAVNKALDSRNDETPV